MVFERSKTEITIIMIVPAWADRSERPNNRERREIRRFGGNVDVLFKIYVFLSFCDIYLF